MKVAEYLKARLEIIDDLHATLYYSCRCGRESYISLHKEKSSKPFWLWISGDTIDNLSISPSVRLFKHIHFSLSDGNVTDHGDEPHE